MRPLACCCAALLLALPAPAQPEQRIDELVRQLADPRQCETAKMALCRLGSRAVPALARALPHAWAEGNAAVRAAARTAAMRVLEALGAEATAALPVLVQCLRDPSFEHHRTLLLNVVGAIGPYCFARVQRLEALDFIQSPAQLVSAARATNRLTFDAGKPIPELLHALGSDNPYVGELAAEAVGLRRGAVTADRALYERTLAALAAFMTAPHRNQVVLRAPNGRTTSVVQPNPGELIHTAQIALARLAPDDPRAIQGHLFRLQLLDPRERSEAAMALGRRGAAAAAAVGALLGALRTSDQKTCHELITALGMIGPAAGTAARSLERLARDGDAETAQRAKAALKQIGPAAVAAPAAFRRRG